jgi:hypothetical protein
MEADAPNVGSSVDRVQTWPSVEAHTVARTVLPSGTVPATTRPGPKLIAAVAVPPENGDRSAIAVQVRPGADDDVADGEVGDGKAGDAEVAHAASRIASATDAPTRKRRGTTLSFVHRCAQLQRRIARMLARRPRILKS